jgi:hypothetical protein
MTDLNYQRDGLTPEITALLEDLAHRFPANGSIS